MSVWSYDVESRSGVLAIHEDMTINHISELKQQFVEAFDQAEKVTVDVSNTLAIDVAGLQLLCACHRFSIAKGKTMCLQVNQNDRFTDFLEEVGFAQDFICMHGGSEECLWSAFN